VLLPPGPQPDAVRLPLRPGQPGGRRPAEVILTADAAVVDVDRLATVLEMLGKDAVEGEAAGVGDPPGREVAAVGLPDHPHPALVEPPLGGQAERAGHEVAPATRGVQAEAHRGDAGAPGTDVDRAEE